MYKHLLALLFLLPFNAMPVDSGPDALPDLPPPPSPGIDGAEELEPEVKIIKREKEVIYEYRINGQLYMVKIEPRVGLPYYLVDGDGDGSLESRYNKLEPDLVVPRWMIYRW